MKIALNCFGVMLLLSQAALAAEADPALQGENEAADEGLLSVLRNGELHLIPRYRYEYNDEDGQRNLGKSSTLRTRLNYRTPAARGWTAFLEIDDVRSLGPDLYNSTRNGRVDRPAIPDPEGTELNQALLSYAGESYALTLGRQRLSLDDQRFIGSSAWRQNEQTFDAITGRARYSRAEFLYSYVDNVNRSVGPDRGSPPGDLRSNSHLLNARFVLGPLGSLATFAYLLEFDNSPELSTNTYGATWNGSFELPRGFSAVYSLSFAQQEDSTNNLNNFTAQFGQLQLGLRYRGWTATVGRDVLTGDANRLNVSFQTPLGTLHGRQGFADKFTITPAQGLIDDYISFSGTWRSLSLLLSARRFASEVSNQDYGHEFDVQLTYRVQRDTTCC
ncbi:MAG: alginate export family protein [Gammaproteobacteria bacterium]|nr:alginate export family protein [Gammaproteobacteria bacterium]